MLAALHTESHSKDALPVCLSPWRENPYGLVSWWDVEQFSGQGLHDAVEELQLHWLQWKQAQPLGDPFAAKLLGQERCLDKDERIALAASLINIAAKIGQSGLVVSQEALSEFITELHAWNIPGHEKKPASTVASRIEECQRTIRREMKSILFFYISAESSKWYRFPLNEWDAVVGRWPATKIDISESSKCMALDRFAAAIFHILLVAEFGVIRICDLFGVSGDKPGWGCVQRLERILAKPFKDRSPLEQQHSELLKEIVPMIVAVKDSSRHKISHVDNRLVWLDTDLSPQIANEVISAARGFMRRLAKELPLVP